MRGLIILVFSAILAVGYSKGFNHIPCILNIFGDIQFNFLYCKTISSEFFNFKLNVVPERHPDNNMRALCVHNAQIRADHTA